MNIQASQKASVKNLLKNILGIASTGAFLSCLIPAVFAQPAFSQDNAPASQTTGGARADEAGGYANPTTRTDDPSRSVPGSNPSMQNNINDSTRMEGSSNTMMEGSNQNYSLQNYKTDLSAKERNTVTISQWPKNRIERYTMPNSTHPELRVDGTNYISVSPEDSVGRNATFAGNMNMGSGSAGGGVSGQMDNMNQSGSYNTAPQQGNTVAPSSGRINDQFTAPTQNMPGVSTFDSPNNRNQQQQMDQSGVGGGTGGQNSFGQANDRMNNTQYNSDGSTLQQQQMNRSNTGVSGDNGGGRADEFGGQTQQRVRVDDPSVSAPEVQNNSGQSTTEYNRSTTEIRRSNVQNNGTTGTTNNNTTPDTGSGSGAGGAVPGLW